MIKAGTIDKGMCLLIKDQPHLVVEREFVNPGKGQAFVRLKLRNLITGQTLQETMKSPEQVEEAEVTERDAQFLYADDEAYHFMDTETFEQFEIQREGMEDRGRYMREGDSYTLQFFEGRAIDIEIPYKLVYEVVESPEAVRGDTVSGATKTVTLETGLQVKVPIFIKTGDKVRVNTESGEYVERVND